MRPWGFNRQRALRALSFANRHMERGEYHQAADIFERLAKGAEDRGILDRAPFLYLQAARARFLADQIERGKSLSRHGLGIFADTQRWRALNRIGQSFVNELRQMGYKDVSQEILVWLNSTLEAHPEAKIASDSSERLKDKKSYVRFPTNCPRCGAGIRPDEIEWLNDFTVQCAYCGSSIPLQE